jgi:hypothetical protein
MRRFSFWLLTAVAFLGTVLASERSAHAYADPGSSLLALQAAGSAVVAVAIYFRRRLYALFHRKPKGADDSSENPPETEER